jgi:hypothetical protein
MGLLYSTGQGGAPLDYVSAHMLFNLAAMRGSVEAKVYRKELSQEMPSEDVAEANAPRANGWPTAEPDLRVQRSRLTAASGLLAGAVDRVAEADGQQVTEVLLHEQARLRRAAARHVDDVEPAKRHQDPRRFRDWSGPASRSAVRIMARPLGPRRMITT